jgi:hypothetical protein
MELLARTHQSTFTPENAGKGMELLARTHQSALPSARERLAQVAHPSAAPANERWYCADRWRGKWAKA